MKNQQKVYHLKADALSDKNKLHNTSLRLFSSDKKEGGKKQFYLFNYDEIFNIIYNKNTNYYENYELNEPIKLFIDIDYESKMAAFHSITLDKLLERSLKLLKEKLKDYGYDENLEYIILKADSPNKLSAHIIFPTVIFKSIDVMKSFMSELDEVKREECSIDLNVYRVGCFRMLHCSKINKNNKLYYYKGNYNLSSDKELFLDTLLLSIRHDTKYINYEIPKLEQKLEQEIIHNENIDDNKLTKLLDLISQKRWDDYSTWLTLCIAIKSNTNNFEIFDKYSKLSNKYNANACKKLWNTIKFKNITVGTIIWFVKQDNPEEFAKLVKNGEIFEETDNLRDIKMITINQQYILGSMDSDLRNHNCIVSKEVDLFMNDESNKCLGVFSSCNTGKSKLIDNIIRTYESERILYVSYRQSLTNNIYGNLKHHDFESYNDNNYSADRLICQVDSLIKIVDINGLISDFDIIIFDEIESILNHFQASTLKNAKYVFEYLSNICDLSKKLIFLDGDLTERSYSYIKHFDTNPVIIKNTYNATPKHFIFNKNIEDFKLKIDEDLKSKKKVVIVSMSSQIALSFENKYKKDYKVICHTSEGDQNHLDNLKDVNNYWNTCDLLIYSPCVEAGVDFNREYFDNMYVILSQESCSPRALMQMTYRIRNYKSNIVNCYINNMIFKEKLHVLTYQNISSYFYKLYPEGATAKLVIDGNKRYYNYSYSDDIYSEIQKYNLLEEYNKKYFFITELIKLLTLKGHTWIYNKENSEFPKNIGIKERHTIIKDRVMAVQDVEREVFNVLLVKQKQRLLTSENKNEIRRYIYKKVFKIKELTREKLDEVYGKIHIFNNFKYLISKDKYKVNYEKEIKDEEDLFIDSDDEEEVNNKLDNGIEVEEEEFKVSPEVMEIVEELPPEDVCSRKIYHKKVICLGLLEKLGFSLNKIKEKNVFNRKNIRALMNDKLVITKESIENIMNEITDKDNFFTRDYKMLFDLQLKNINFSTVKSFLGVINIILKSFGIYVLNKQYSVKKDGIISSKNFYMLCVDPVFCIE